MTTTCSGRVCFYDEKKHWGIIALPSGDQAYFFEKNMYQLPHDYVPHNGDLLNFVLVAKKLQIPDV